MRESQALHEQALKLVEGKEAASVRATLLNSLGNFTALKTVWKMQRVHFKNH